MVAMSSIATFDLLVGSLASIALLYLLYSQTMVVHYRRFFRLITIGLLIYAITGPIVGRIAPAWIHAIHGVAVLFITVGLYDLIREDLRREADFNLLLDTAPRDTAFDAEPAEEP